MVNSYMKTQELLTPQNIIIKEAPEVGPDQPLGLTDPKTLNSLESTKQNIEGFELFAKKIGDQTIFALKHNNEILTVLVVTEITDFPGSTEKTTLMVNRSWTPPNFRGKGYSPALYDGLGKLGYRILSDRQTSQNALNVWNKLSKKRKLKAFDWKTKQYTDKDPINNPNISIVLEHDVCFNRTNSILKDQLFWTTQ